MNVNTTHDRCCLGPGPLFFLFLTRPSPAQPRQASERVESDGEADAGGGRTARPRHSADRLHAVRASTTGGEGAAAETSIGLLAHGARGCRKTLRQCMPGPESIQLDRQTKCWLASTAAVAPLHSCWPSSLVKAPTTSLPTHSRC